MTTFNIFSLLNIKTVEDPHDRMVAWLCDPNGGHGIPDIAQDIVRSLWKSEHTEPVRKIHRPFKLSEESWPDIGIEFSSALLLIENKVQASALRPGQVELQHELGIRRQGESPFFHCVLCPDRLVPLITHPSSNFRVLTYNLLHGIVSSRLSYSTESARTIIEQYLSFIQSSFVETRGSAVKVAHLGDVIHRKASQGWQWEEILEESLMHGDTDLAEAHRGLYDILLSMEDVEPRFDSKGDSDKTYKVYLTNRNVLFILQIYSDGQLYVSWQGFSSIDELAAVAKMQSIWGAYLKGPRNKVGSFTRSRLGTMTPELLGSLLQETADHL